MKKTSSSSIFLAFLVVALPLGWGLYRSIKNSMPLFTASKAPPAAVVPAGVPAAPASK
ncbi:MAG TPA: hypothetical protein VIJ19_11525 [Opitutaceae bacterium]